jgi:hypothetical protein
MGGDQKFLFFGRIGSQYYPRSYWQRSIFMRDIEESSEKLWFIRIMSRIKYKPLIREGVWCLLRVTGGRPSSFQDVREWETPWPRVNARGTVEGRRHHPALTS